MIDLPHEIRFALRANAIASAARADKGERFDPYPVLKLFNPIGAATWLASELDADEDTLFGLADLGFGYPKLGSFSLREIADARLPYGLGIERDTGFAACAPLSVYAEAARRTGSLAAAERLLAFAARVIADRDTPSPPEGG